jgi:hypothetical protein
MTTANLLWNPGTSNNGLTASAFTLMADTSELTNLTNGTYIVSSVSGTSGVFSNVNSAQAMWGQIFLTLGAIGAALLPGGNLCGWFLRSWDGGTTFENPGATTQPSRTPDFIVPLPGTTIAGGAVYAASGLVMLPALKYKVGVVNIAGQTLAASGNLLRCAPMNMQSI